MSTCSHAAPVSPDGIWAGNGRRRVLWGGERPAEVEPREDVGRLPRPARGRGVAVGGLAMLAFGPVGPRPDLGTLLTRATSAGVLESNRLGRIRFGVGNISCPSAIISIPRSVTARCGRKSTGSGRRSSCSSSAKYCPSVTSPRRACTRFANRDRRRRHSTGTRRPPRAARRPAPPLRGRRGVATAVWAPAEPSLAVETGLADFDEYEVRVYDAARGRRLVAAVEIGQPRQQGPPREPRAVLDEVRRPLAPGGFGRTGRRGDGS